MTEGFFSGLLGWRSTTTKKTRKPGAPVRESDLICCIEPPAMDEWYDYNHTLQEDHGLVVAPSYKLTREAYSKLAIGYDHESEFGGLSHVSTNSSPEFYDAQSEESKSSVRLNQHALASLDFAKNWTFIDSTDDYRVSYAHKKGGVPLTDIRIQNKIRESGSEILKSMGRKILSGDFNLTTISFPIKCMEDKTVLHNTIKAMLMDSLYINRAALLKDPVERLRLVVISKISCFIHTCTFLKPMNPILGETLYAHGPDGSEYYCEQTSHHPPVSHFLVIGPQQRFTSSGYYVFEAKAGLNSLRINNMGKRRVQFQDGQTITFNCPNEYFTNSLIGTLKHEVEGPMIFLDEANQLECIVTFGKVKGKPSDYVEGLIIRNGTTLISKLSGTYLGWLEFDGRRYWDARHVTPNRVTFDVNLPSDSEVRSDLLALRQGNMEAAQRNKEDLENSQRHDRNLRTKHQRKQRK